MAALLTMLAVMSIVMSALLPVWRHEMRREKEAELVFRGEQYVKAIELYNRKFRSNPAGIDILVQQKFLRKKYKDPITGEDFRPIYAGAAQQAGPTRPGPGNPATAPAAPAPAAGQASTLTTGGIIGVTSTSDKDSIRIYKGRSKYNQWQFVYAGLTRRPGGPQGPGAPRPGMPGGPQGPGIGRPRPGGPPTTQPSPRRPGGPPTGMRPPGDIR